MLTLVLMFTQPVEVWNCIQLPINIIFNQCGSPRRLYCSSELFRLFIFSLLLAERSVPCIIRFSELKMNES